MLLVTVNKNMAKNNQPVNNIEWVHVDDLEANDYNPNKVPEKELKLLKKSIEQDGWTIPIIVLENGQIIDGFHRWSLTKTDDDIYEMTDGEIPVVRIDRDEAERRYSTIRYNRARGEHSVNLMSELVKELVNKGVAKQDVAEELGMEMEEVKRLYNATPMPEEASEDSFSQAWKPNFEK